MSIKIVGLSVLSILVVGALGFFSYTSMSKKSEEKILPLPQQKIDESNPYGSITAADKSILSFERDKENIFIVLKKPNQEKKTFGYGYPKSNFEESEYNTDSSHKLMASNLPHIFYAKMNFAFQKQVLNRIYDFIDIEKEEMLHIQYSLATHKLSVSKGEKQLDFSLSPFEECATVSLNGTLDENGKASIQRTEEEKCNAIQVTVKGVDEKLEKIYNDFEDSNTHTVTRYVQDITLPLSETLKKTTEQPPIPIANNDTP